MTFLNRKECCERFNVEDGDDNIKIMEHIINEVPPNTALLFDEVPLTSKVENQTTSYDWSSLENKRSEEVSVVVSLQPLLLEAKTKTKSQDVAGPRNADVIRLTSQYRNTKTITGFVNQLCRQELPVEYANVPISSSHDLQGPDIEVVSISDLNQAGRLRVWLCNQLQQELACKPSCVKMIFVSNTEELAQKVVKETVYEGSLTTIDDFQGCETSVAVVFFSKAPDGDYSQLLEMCSRARYKLFLVMFDNQTLHDMIAHSDMGISVKDIRDLDPPPALTEAMRSDNAALVQQLLGCGANVNDCDRDGLTHLSIASKTNNVPLLKQLLDHGASVNLRSKDGSTPLHVAAKLGFNEVCEILTDYGAGLGEADQEGNTPLMIAAENGHLSTLTLLLEKGAVCKEPPSAASDMYNHKSQILCIGWQPGTELLASGTEDGSLIVWKKGSDNVEETCHGSAVTCLDWSVGRNLLVTGCFGGSGSVWRGSSKIASLKGHTDWITKIKFNGSGGLVVTASDDKTCRVWQAATGKMIRKMKFESRVNAILWRDVENIISGCSNGIIQQWRIDQAYTLFTLKGDSLTLMSLSFQPDSNLLASCSWGVILWKLDSPSPTLLHTLTGHKSPIYQVKFSPSQSHLLATWDTSWEVRLWDALAGNCLHLFQCKQDGLEVSRFEENYIDFSPNGQLLACRGAEVKVFRVATGKLAAVFQVEGKMVSWNNSSNKLATVTNSLSEREKGHRVIVIDIYQVSCPKIRHFSPKPISTRKIW